MPECAGNIGNPIRRIHLPQNILMIICRLDIDTALPGSPVCGGLHLSASPDWTRDVRQ